MKKITLLLLFSIPLFYYAQKPIWGGVTDSYNIYSEALTGIGNKHSDVDQYGNSFHIFEKRGIEDININNQVNTYVDSNLTILKSYDINGKLRWYKRIRKYYSASYGDNVKIDQKGNVIIWGYFLDSLSLEDLQNKVYISGNNSYSDYIAKYDNNGKLLWVKSFRSQGELSFKIIGVDTDSKNNIIICANYRDTVDLGLGSQPNYLYNSANGDFKTFLLKIDENANFKWVKNFESLTDQYYKQSGDISVNPIDNSIVFGGTFKSSSCYAPNYCRYDLDPGPGTTDVFIKIGNRERGFIAAYDSSGNYLWNYMDNYGGYSTSQSRVLNLHHSKSGNLYAFGYTNSGILIIKGVTYTASAYGFFYALKFSPNGQLIWGRPYEGANNNNSIVNNMGSMDIDSLENVFTCSRTYSNIDYDPGPGTLNFPNSQFSNDNVYIMKLDSGGNFKSAKQLQGRIDIGAGAILNVNRQNLMVSGLTHVIDVVLKPSQDSLIIDRSKSNGYHYFIMNYNLDSCSDLSLKTDSINNISCNNQSKIMVHAYGGKHPYTYSWNTTPVVNDSTLNLTTPGIYTVSVSDSSGCIASNAYLINGKLVLGNGFDLKANLHTTNFRPGVSSFVQLDAFNDGCTPISGNLALIYDTTLLVYNSSTLTPSTISGDTLFWNFQNITYDSLHITPKIYFTTKTTAQIGDKVCFETIINPITGDADTTNNIKNYCFPVINGYDPNDKQVYPQGECIPGYIDTNQVLTYTVRFQNTGNASAINIYVLDSLDTNLDLNSVRVVGSSHKMHTEVLPGNTLKFVFNNIHLPDSNSNEALSHGYVIFEVSPTPNLAHGTPITNDVGIYFDYNPPVYTNTVLNTISDGLHKNSTSNVNQTACGSFTLNNQTYTSSGTYIQTISNSYGCDSTITVNLTILNNSSSSINPTSCNSYISPSGNYIWSVSGNYSDTIPNAIGCDSIITINLTINNADTSVTQSGPVLTANVMGASYQWVDCNNNYQAITGATSQTYSPTANGNYAVIVTENGCTDTSACYAVTNVGIHTASNNNTISIYPNPTKDTFTIVSTKLLNNATIMVSSLLGQHIYKTEKINETSFTIDISQQPKGIYIVEIIQENATQQIQIIKE